MQIKLELTGVTPLLCHNIALADPDNEITREIATYTGKRKKTEDDRRAIERLEWFGGLYLDQGRPVLPTANIKKSLVQAAKVNKLGTAVTRALTLADLYVPIVYDGPADLEQLHANSAYHHRASVGISGKRTMRVRPQFPQWAIVAEGILLDEIMDRDDFTRVVANAGQIEGLGDNRINGYGRFRGEVRA